VLLGSDHAKGQLPPGQAREDDLDPVHQYAAAGGSRGAPEQKGTAGRRGVPELRRRLRDREEAHAGGVRAQVREQ